MILYVLPQSKHHLVETGIKAAQEGHRSLFTALELLVEELIGEATPINKSSLQVGRKYNILDVSTSANAWRGGALKANHGELYEYSYHLAEDGMLTQENAWGVPSFRRITPSMLLIER